MDSTTWIHDIRSLTAPVEPANRSYRKRGDMRKSVYGMAAIFAMLVTVSAAPLMGQAKEKSLYDRLGKKKAITAVVDEFVARAAGDMRVNRYFAATAGDPARMKKFKTNLVDQ